MELWRKAAKAGSASAQCSIAHCYATGDGTQKDLVEAFRWYSQAATQGLAEAQYELGSCYMDGRGTSKDEQKGADYYRKAADQGHHWAQYNLATAYDNGSGIPQDHTQAVGWYRKAAESGFAPAQFQMGSFTEDPEEALRWVRRSADQGYALAQIRMASHCAKVQKDNVEALKWCVLASKPDKYLGSAELIEPDGTRAPLVVFAQSVVAEILPRMTPDQIQQAQRLADAFVVRREGPSTNSVAPQPSGRR